MHISSEIDVDVIANTIVKGQSDMQNKSDPYWDDMAEMLLKALIYYLMATRPEEEMCIRDRIRVNSKCKWKYYYR